MSKIALGTVQFGLSYGIANKTGQITQIEAARILGAAAKFGINVLDTAIAYGESEAALGMQGVGEFKVVTKLPPVPAGIDDVSRWVRSEVDGSLSRLGVKSLYGLLLHRSGDLFGKFGKGMLSSLHDLKQQGLVEKVGVSVYAPDELDLVTEMFDMNLVQAPLNVVDRRLETSGWLAKLNDLGVEVHARSAFLQGLLLMKRDEIPEKFNRWSVLWDEWQHQLKANQVNAVAACLGYPLSLAEVDRVVVGVDSAAQLQEILTASNTVVNSVEWVSMVCDNEHLTNPSEWKKL